MQACSTMAARDWPLSEGQMSTLLYLLVTAYKEGKREDTREREKHGQSRAWSLDRNSAMSAETKDKNIQPLTRTCTRANKSSTIRSTLGQTWASTELQRSGPPLYEYI